MERAEIDRLVQRLVENPHDEESLAYAHQAGEQDPKAYAMLLERVGSETRDPAYAAHWLAEAANVWSTTLGDAHRAARVLMMAIDKDPTAQVAAERLAQLYREKGDTKALVALLDRRAKALAPLTAQNPDLRGELAGMHEELGRLWSEAPLSQPKKAIENYKKAIELDPTSAYAIYNARELYKQMQEWANAIPLYAAELALEQDPARRVGLMRDEATTRKLSGDLQGATRAYASAREIDGSDPALQQEYAITPPSCSSRSPRPTRASTVSPTRAPRSTSSPAAIVASSSTRTMRARWAPTTATSSPPGTTPTSRRTPAGRWPAKCAARSALAAPTRRWRPPARAASSSPRAAA
jgi:tetratricopeptide (TPR) repeat protein